MLNPERKNLIVSCDPGGAQILSSWVRTVQHKENYIYCLEDSAKVIFNNKLDFLSMVGLEEIHSLDPAIDRVLTSTSSISDLERKAIAMAKQRGVLCISILDHWANYRERFIPYSLWKEVPKNWRQFLPDEIWVCDENAYHLAIEKGFPSEIIVQIKNPYFVEIKQNLGQKKKGENFNKEDVHILYISEPIAKNLELTYADPNYHEYTEFDLVRYLIDSFIDCINKGKKVKLRFRLHPKESNDKYDYILSGVSEIQTSLKGDLLDDIVWADAVVGGQSMALVVACLAEKPVFRYMPIKAIRTRKVEGLPYREIQNIDSIMEVINKIT